MESKIASRQTWFPREPYSRVLRADLGHHLRIRLRNQAAPAAQKAGLSHPVARVNIRSSGMPAGYQHGRGRAEISTNPPRRRACGKLFLSKPVPENTPQTTIRVKRSGTLGNSPQRNEPQRGVGISRPNIPLVIFHVVFFQERDEFIFELNSLVVLLLARNVFRHPGLRWIDSR